MKDSDKIWFTRLYASLLLASMLSGCASLLQSGFQPEPQDSEAADTASPFQNNHRKNGFRQEINTSRLSQSLYLGMPMHEVENSWGQPSQVYHAGFAESSSNQKWVYSLSPSSWGLGQRVVYFENGQVVGWETTDSTQ